MMDDYCLKCHQDAYDGWFHSAHHFSSFNNKAYLTSVRETRKVALERDGYDPGRPLVRGLPRPGAVLLGRVRRPQLRRREQPDQPGGHHLHGLPRRSPTSTAPAATPPTRSRSPSIIRSPPATNPVLQWINNDAGQGQARDAQEDVPEAGRSRTPSSARPATRWAFPYAVNHYKDFVRGQNHYDTFLLSGVSGHGARSFYYPPVAKVECVECHMELHASSDFGARDFDGKGGREIHNHLFLGRQHRPGRRSRATEDAAEAHAKFLKDKKVRVDVFAPPRGRRDRRQAPGPAAARGPDAQAGQAVPGRGRGADARRRPPFTQGTVDSNEIWVELIATVGRPRDRPLGRHRRRRHGRPLRAFHQRLHARPRRQPDRPPQSAGHLRPPLQQADPPGSRPGRSLRPRRPRRPRPGRSRSRRKVNYRKFDRKYMDYIFGKGQGPELPVVVMASDAVAACRSREGRRSTNEPSPIKDGWQRWNDYGIGLLLEGGDQGGPEGRAEAGRAGLPEGRRAGPGRRLGEPGPCLSAGRPDSRRPRGPREGRQRTRSPPPPG